MLSDLVLLIRLCMRGQGAATSWAVHISTSFSLWHILNTEEGQTQDIAIKISSFLVVIPDFPALTALCEQSGFFASILRQVVLVREIDRFGYDLAIRRRGFRRARLVLLRDLGAIEGEFVSHRSLML